MPDAFPSKPTTSAWSGERHASPYGKKIPTRGRGAARLKQEEVPKGMLKWIQSVLQVSMFQSNLDVQKMVQSSYHQTDYIT